MYIIDEILSSVISGFGIYCVVLFFATYFKSIKENKPLSAFDDTTTLLVRFAGFLVVGSWIIYIYSAITSSKSDLDEMLVINRMFGPYWFAFWSRPIIYLLATQLLWIKWIRRSTFIKMIFGVLLICAWNVERIIIVITSMHRDFLPSSWASYTSPIGILLKFLCDFAVFLTISAIIHFIRKRYLQLNTVS